ncbi:MAG: hypothetical protein QOF56_917 [Acidobacteriaceae bacterium]|jgi:hypothetical protein|nr:hypothetical protein [Acidobacteriaceae bacterium]
MTTKSGPYRFTVKETARGTFWLAAEPAGKTIEDFYGLLGFELQTGTTLEEANRIASLMNERITSLTLTN